MGYLGAALANQKVEPKRSLLSGPPDRVLSVQFDEDASTEVFESDFRDANSEDVRLCAEVRGLGIGESTTVGGGAAPMVKITVLR